MVKNNLSEKYFSGDKFRKTMIMNFNIQSLKYSKWYYGIIGTGKSNTDRSNMLRKDFGDIKI